ncbi:TOBE domain-containing protein, partial [Bordetella pertussis]
FVQHLAASGLDAAGDIDIMRRFMLKTSARNRLLGTVEAVHAGAVNDEIVLRIAGGQRIAAVITRASTEELGLAPGTQAIALIKAQAVLLGLPGPGLRLSARNQLPGKVAEVRPGAVNSEIIVDLDGGGTLAAIITEESARDLALAAGMPVCALFDAASVMLGVLD